VNETEGASTEVLTDLLRLFGSIDNLCNHRLRRLKIRCEPEKLICSPVPRLWFIPLTSADDIGGIAIEGLSRRGLVLAFS
jgi:hypothetical protein